MKRLVGYLPENAPAYPEMTVEEFLGFIAEIRGFRTAAQKQPRIERVVGLCHLGPVRRQSIETLSKGYKQRVGFAQALLHDPPVLVLDEPTDGLDPNQKHEVRNLIKQMAAEKTVILSTHILEEVEAICTRIDHHHRAARWSSTTRPRDCAPAMPARGSTKSSARLTQTDT